jgi:flotillin
MDQKEKNDLIKKAIIGTCLVGGTVALFSRYKTSRSNEWLVKTGILVEDLMIGKKFFQLPFQNIQKITVTPKNYNLNINSMSKEKMEFQFPIVFTLGPKLDDEALTKYAKLMLNLDDQETVIRSIIEGSARSLAANMSIEDIFTARTEFKNNIIEHVQPQLEQYGIAVYNANIEELKDSESSNYFKSLSLKIKAEAENKARVQVAEQNKFGQIGSKERDAETRQRIALVESETIIIENQRRQEMLKSQAELDKIKSEQDLIANTAQIKALNESEKIKMAMEKDVQILKVQMEIEKARAAELSVVQVNAEKTQKEAEGKANAQRLKADADLYTKQKDADAILVNMKLKADGDLYYKQKDADAVRAKADSDLYTKQKDADAILINMQLKADGDLYYKQKEAEAIKAKAEADFYATQKQAEGMNEIFEAQSQGINKLVKSFEGNTQALITYMMLEKDQFTKLAESSAKAVQGLNPKITIWNTNGENTYDGISKLGKSLVPMLDTIKEQTGYQLPDWIIKQEKELK